MCVLGGGGLEAIGRNLKMEILWMWLRRSVGAKTLLHVFRQLFVCLFVCSLEV